MLAYLPCSIEHHQSALANSGRHGQKNLVHLPVLKCLHRLHDRPQCSHPWLVELLLRRSVYLAVQHILLKVPRRFQKH